MECVIGYVKILCAGTAARVARLKFENCDLTMMLSTNCYKNYSRVFSMPSLTSVEVSKHYSKHIRRYCANKIVIYIIIPKCACVCLYKFYLKTVSVNDLILFAT